MRYTEVKVRPERFAWTDQAIERLKSCLADGMSASEIGDEFGVTRNAIIGKARRLGLDFSRKPYSRGMGKPKPFVFRKAPLKPAMRYAPAVPPPAPEPEPIPIDDMAIPTKQRRTLLTLRKRECRWPVGDPLLDPQNFFFCGASQKDGSSYCPHHDRRSKQ